MTQTAASLDALLARQRSTPLEADMATAILDCRITMFGPVTAQPPPPPPPAGPANYTVAPSDWSFGGNFRLPIIGARAGAPITVDFTTPATLGMKAQIQPAADPGYFGQFEMTIDGRKQTGGSPAFPLITGPSVIKPPPLPFMQPTLQWQGLQPGTRYRITILPNANGNFHVNFQSAS